jgi:ribose-phosphate pyrophosphokinase
MSDTNLMVFSGNANLALSEGIVKKLNMRLGMATLGRFSDGEIAFEVEENVRGKEI